ncbi:hypothetical protein SU69_08580 [Thermosipho melanesiensis]|uniref:DUF86 domain-containing protein n=2 Tax=Thermosipho melanesiensis TaxID=46541 RepID=A6LNN5_THEM4|nr:DUF86 domain-containing protein [Thermosipho melanesiensis]ABR31536.1 protein of unknown function DUF86 [Thermosipho melanesiensis BI429]APT74575.1 hypothetical protein BW47_08955 [Thermosipho melanesiensis]OOC35280.1 hypothetical protein SU69_08580 [Thermosipho melanesiensis]OOC35499.1 hypothetical protein SU70_08590 [Thermosipho melanesiensis]OOC36535.1 hypothetical protein SU68_08645 [Thermosipho melanesiensis]
MRRDIKLYVNDILDAILAIEKFVEGMNFEKFKRDDKTSSAVIRKFEIIGEATKHIPDEIRQKYPNIPWKEMAGFRDKLIHFYFGIKYELVWNTIKIELPELKNKIEKVLKELGGE